MALYDNCKIRLVLVGIVVAVAVGAGGLARGSEACVCPGDLNEDQQVDLEDLQGVAGILLDEGSPFIADCADCIEEGQSGPVEPTGPECCPGLVSKSEYTIDRGTCRRKLGVFICTDCGDKVCGPGEDWCNCRHDCPEQPDGGS